MHRPDAIASELEPPLDPSRLLEDTRAKLGETALGWFALTMVMVSALIGYQTYRTGVSRPPVLALIAVMSTILPIWLARRHLGSVRASYAFAVHLGIVSMVALPLSSLAPGVVLVQMLLTLYCALLFGARGGALALGYCLFELLAAWLLVDAGVVRPIDRVFWNPMAPVVWLRYAVLLALGGGGLTAAYCQVVDALERNARQLHETLLRERGERAVRERAVRALEEAKRSELIAQLATGLTHDFNNNLFLIMAAADEARRLSGAGAEGLGAALQTIEQTAENAAEITRDLLDIVRKAQPSTDVVQPGEVIARLQSMLRHAFPKSITVQLSDQGARSVRIAPSRLQQALLNLALNARDAMPHGGTLLFGVRDVRIECSARAPQGGDFVAISCTDTGGGMDGATQARIFEPFFTTKQVGKGTGLGLMMVRTLIEDAGGFMEVESKLGHGTTFRLLLPSATSAGDPLAAPLRADARV